MDSNIEAMILSNIIPVFNIISDDGIKEISQEGIVRRTILDNKDLVIKLSYEKQLPALISLMFIANQLSKEELFFALLPCCQIIIDLFDEFRKESCSLEYIGQAFAKFMKLFNQQLPEEKYVPKYNMILNDPNSSNIILNVEGKDILCHKEILTLLPYFNIMFTSPMSEKHKQKIDLYDENYDLFYEMIDYLYNGKNSLDYPLEHLIDLFIKANKYQFSELINDCSNEIVKLLNIENITDIIDFSLFYYEPALIDGCFKYVISNFWMIGEDEKFSYFNSNEKKQILSKTLSNITLKYIEKM